MGIKRPVFGLVFVGEIAVVGYAAFMIFLFGAWMESDAFAIGASDSSVLEFKYGPI